jgi:hypothetical protein
VDNKLLVSVAERLQAYSLDAAIALIGSRAQFRDNSIADQMRLALWCHSLDPRLLGSRSRKAC